MRLSRHQLWSGSSYDGAACRPRRCPVQVVPSDHTQLCGKQSNLYQWQTFLPCRPAQPHRGARHWNARGRTATTTPAPRGHLPTHHLRVLSPVHQFPVLEVLNSQSSFQFSSTRASNTHLYRRPILATHSSAINQIS